MNAMFHKCASCGRNGAMVISNGKYFCLDCTKLFGTCAMCVNRVKCEFNSNPAPIPKVITQHIRQKTETGIMEQITQAPNPQRIKAFCIEEKCVCCDHADRPHCMRQFGVCDNYEEIEF